MRFLVTGATGYIGGRLTSRGRGAAGGLPRRAGWRGQRERSDTVPEAQLGGGDVLTYREMMLRFADLTDRRRPLMVGVPLLTHYTIGYDAAVRAALVA